MNDKNNPSQLSVVVSYAADPTEEQHSALTSSS